MWWLFTFIFNMRRWWWTTFQLAVPQSYPSEITEVHESSLKIKVMERTGGNFKWPKREGNVYYVMEYVCKSSNHHIVVGNRG